MGAFWLWSWYDFLFVATEITGPIVLDTYRVIGDFEKTSKHEITLQTGDLVEIVEKSTNGEKRPVIPADVVLSCMASFITRMKFCVFAGWWFCQCDTSLGWVPASYLEPLDAPEEPEEAEPNYAGKWPGSRFWQWRAQTQNLYRLFLIKSNLLSMLLLQ